MLIICGIDATKGQDDRRKREKKKRKCPGKFLFCEREVCVQCEFLGSGLWVARDYYLTSTSRRLQSKAIPPYLHDLSHCVVVPT